MVNDFDSVHIWNEHYMWSRLIKIKQYNISTVNPKTHFKTVLFIYLLYWKGRCSHKRPLYKTLPTTSVVEYMSVLSVYMIKHILKVT